MTIEDSALLGYFRPRGKIVCIGDIPSALDIIREYLDVREEARLPLLHLTAHPVSDDLCDQIIVFNSEAVLSQVHNLLNAYFLLFIFNSSDTTTLPILMRVLDSIRSNGAIPLLIDIGTGFEKEDHKLIPGSYFHLDSKEEQSRWEFLVLLDSIISVFQSPKGLGVTFSDLIQIFGNTEQLFYGFSSSPALETCTMDAIDKAGQMLAISQPENLEKLETLFVTVHSQDPLSLKEMNRIVGRLSTTFGKDLQNHFSNVVGSCFPEYTMALMLTDNHPIEAVLPAPLQEIDSLITSLDTSQGVNGVDTSVLDIENSPDEDGRYKVLGQIFTESEVYIFEDGGLPLFASHRPAGQEVCLYTGLFSAIQSMSSDLIGHTPDHLTAGDKQCVFTSQTGPDNAQLRGVAIYAEGNEHHARKDLEFTMNLVKTLLGQGEPAYAVNDLVQQVLIQEFQKGSINTLLHRGNYHAS
ncbi:MAG: hypothetical protein ACFFE8_00570 [Candidatus Heimdallarchaeota archaeon]